MAVEPGHFDADFAESGMHGFPLAGKDAAFGGGGGAAERGGLREEHFVKHGFVFGFAEDGDERAGAILFHLHGGGENIEGARGEGFFEEVAVDLRIHVVEIGFEDADGFGFRNRALFGGFADQQAENAGVDFEIGGSGAIDDRVAAHSALST